MKVTSRERLLLTGLLFLVILAAGYFLLIEPQIKTVTKTAFEKATYVDQVNTFKNDIAQESKLQKNLSDMETKISEASKVYYPEILFEKMILDINNMVAISGSSLKQVAFTVVDAKAVTSAEQKIANTTKADSMVNSYNQIDTGTTGASQAASAGTAAATDAANANTVYSTTAGFQLDGSYAQLNSFISQLKSNGRKVVINQVNLVRTETGTIQGNIQVTFYALPKLIPQDGAYINWALNNPKGTSDPFKAF